MPSLNPEHVAFDEMRPPFIEGDEEGEEWNLGDSLDDGETSCVMPFL